MENLESIKERIVDAMAEYYGEKYRANIEECIGNINVYLYSNAEEAKSIMSNEHYDSIIYPDCCYYCRMVEKYDVSVPAVEEFIAISKRICDTPEKQLYALIESYIKLFMSQDNNLDKNHINSRVCFDVIKDYYLNRGVVKVTFDNSEYKEPVLFENACTRYDAMRITQNILVTNEKDFMYYKDIYFDCVCPLLDNDRTRGEINFARINHLKLEDTPGKPLKTIQAFIDSGINEVFSDEIAKQEKLKELSSIINQMNIKFPNGDEKQK